MENSIIGNVFTERDKKSKAIPLKKYTEAYVVSFAVLSERFSFWGLQAVMTLFLMQYFYQSEQRVFTLVGAFGALSYAFSLLGGLLADKFIGVWKSCLFGLILCLLGNSVLIFSDSLISLNIGLSCILVGAGLFSPSSNNLIHLLYEKKSDLRESGFLISCVAGNISGALAPLIYGIFGAKGIWHGAFLVSAILNCFSSLYLIKHYNHFRQACGNQLYQANNNKLGKIIVVCFVGIAFGLLVNINWLNTLLLIGIIPLCFLAFLLYRQLNECERQRVKFIFFLTGILLLFYVAVFQIYSSLTLFIDHYVNRQIMGWEIPVPAFASLQCVFFILSAPIVERLLAVFRRKGYMMPLLIKIPVGLIIAAVGFSLFAFGKWIAFKSGSCGIEWIIVGNFFLGLGEVFLYPPILTVVSSFSPRKWAGTLMGGFSISLAFASYFSGKLAWLLTSRWMINTRQIESVFHLGYAKIVLLLIGISVLSIIMFSFLKKWYHLQINLLNSNS